MTVSLLSALFSPANRPQRIKIRAAQYIGDLFADQLSGWPLAAHNDGVAWRVIVRASFWAITTPFVAIMNDDIG